jgi:hypothetical protein
MKKIILLITLFLCVYSAKGGTPVPIGGVVNPTGGVTRSRTVAPSVTGTLEQDYLQINYFRDLGTVTTTIYNEFGEVVYENETVTGHGQVETIYTVDFEPGEYTIVLTNSAGMHLEGIFVL